MPLTKLLRYTLTVLCILCGPAHAATDQKQCTKLALLIGIVDLTSVILNAENNRLPSRFEALQNLSLAIDQDVIRLLLQQSGNGNSQADFAAYMDDLNRFIQVRRLNGALYGGWILNAPDFRDRHARMTALSEDLCHLNPRDQTFEMLDTGADRLRAKNSSDTTDTSDTSGKTQTKLPKKIAQLQTSPPNSSSWSQPFRIRKEMLLLFQVFFLLALTLFTIFVISFALKFVRAIRLDRYECSIPATLEVAGVEIRGRIDVLGNRGLSFEVTAPADPTHEHHLQLDRHVRFITDAMEFHAVLTKAFDGSAGFRLSMPLTKPTLRALLDLSQTKPRRKIEMGRKTKAQKKPAAPIKAALALKSRSSPADKAERRT